jgi:hypothetical protein
MNPPGHRQTISQYFKLGAQQWALDFVDVPVRGDVKVYVDPTAIRRVPGDWGQWCVSLIQDFFSSVLDAIREGRWADARYLLSGLREPNEVHLGHSKGMARGRGIGRDFGEDILVALRDSKALASGALMSLEDAVLMIPGVGGDRISDIAVNVIRLPLIAYTQGQCQQHGIPMRPNVASGRIWDSSAKSWISQPESLPVIDGRRLILVPKAIARVDLEYSEDEFFREYMLPYLQEREIEARSGLVQLLKNGEPRVLRKDLVQKYGKGKTVVAAFARDHPELIDRYRKLKDEGDQRPVDHLEFWERGAGSEPPMWTTLMDAIRSSRPGYDDAAAYQRSVAELLTALFYPVLVNPQVEHRLHEGRKRVDITFWNMANVPGFFQWVHKHYPASYLLVECKNYDGDPANPELDQLAGRFGPNRGQVGLLICRRITDRQLFTKRCRDTAQDQRGFIVALDDSDLELLVGARAEGRPDAITGLLKQRFDELVM